jgi:hypothetical protein
VGGILESGRNVGGWEVAGNGTIPLYWWNQWLAEGPGQQTRATTRTRNPGLDGRS